MSGITVSFVQCASEVETRSIALEKVIYAIRTGGKKLKGQITQIRNRFESELALQGDYKAAKKLVDPLKKQLPGVLYSAKKIARRENEAVEEHSGLICTDLDSLNGDIDKVWTELTESPYVMLAFHSPCGDGIKAVFKVVPDISRHQDSFRAIQQYVLQLTGKEIDKKCKDVARMNFMSFDPEVYVNPDALLIEPLPPEPKRPIQNSAVADLGLRQRCAVELLGEIDWDSVSHGFLLCPGKHLHTTGDNPRDCEIHLDGAPTLHCFHDHCSGFLAGLNHELRSRIAKAERESASEERQSADRDSEWATDLSAFISLDEARFPAPLAADAFYGLPGKIVQRILPETEADPAALLFTFLAGFGNMIGRTAHMVADGARHYLNLFVVTVGRTAISRKRTAWVRIKPVLELIDEDWVKDNVESGLSSGEGVIHRIRDKIDEERPVKEKGRYTGEYETVTVDPGIDDKRLFVLETEFCSPLKVMNREGNTLSPVLRAAWDGDDLGTLTKNSRERATKPYVSMIGHITREELRKTLNETEAANGFGNRNLWPAAKRSKSLPKGGEIPAIADFIDPLKDALLFAQNCGELTRDDETEELWAQVYPELSEGKPGLLGAIIARAAPQVLRLQALYAVLDCSSQIRVAHLKAALACWQYAEASARWIFETGTGNKVADRILAALIAAGEKGLTKTEIVHDLFNRNVTKFTIDEALRLLHRLSLAFCQSETTKGRPAERWFFKSIDDINDKNDKGRTYVVKVV
jgi:BT4734-like, N-terminal domain/Protein of unknown function (DUF3987)